MHHLFLLMHLNHSFRFLYWSRNHRTDITWLTSNSSPKLLKFIRKLITVPPCHIVKAFQWSFLPPRILKFPKIEIFNPWSHASYDVMQLYQLHLATAAWFPYKEADSAPDDRGQVCKIICTELLVWVGKVSSYCNPITSWPVHLIFSPFTNT